MANGSHSPSPATPMSPDSSTEFTCLVCLRNLHSCSKLGKPENCGHVFCLTCITQWGKVCLSVCVGGGGGGGGGEVRDRTALRHQ